ncbi:hypothetical protein B0H14DRAFT_3508357 [Mycena olivaceomarginata]|nr:hypothetical protein B0H14DRAFT_3508357 [Mycena olivaceomarginata]
MEATVREAKEAEAAAKEREAMKQQELEKQKAEYDNKLAAFISQTSFVVSAPQRAGPGFPQASPALVPRFIEGTDSRAAIVDDNMGIPTPANSTPDQCPANGAPNPQRPFESIDWDDPRVSQRVEGMKANKNFEDDVDLKWKELIRERIIDAMVEKALKMRAATENKCGLPDVSGDYLEALIHGLLKDAQRAWKQHQPRMGETAEQAHMRAEAYEAQQATRVLSLSRKTQKLEGRIRVVRKILHIETAKKRQETVTNWQWILELLEHLGTGGMSSEDDIDAETVVVEKTMITTVHLVKICPWRSEEVTKYLHWIDRAAESTAVKPLNKRPRVQSQLMSETPPPPRVPREIYNDGLSTPSRFLSMGLWVCGIMRKQEDANTDGNAGANLGKRKRAEIGPKPRLPATGSAPRVGGLFHVGPTNTHDWLPEELTGLEWLLDTIIDEQPNIPLTMQRPPHSRLLSSAQCLQGSSPGDIAVSPLRLPPKPPLPSIDHGLTKFIAKILRNMHDHSDNVYYAVSDPRIVESAATSYCCTMQPMYSRIIRQGTFWMALLAGDHAHDPTHGLFHLAGKTKRALRCESGSSDIAPLATRQTITTYHAYLLPAETLFCIRAEVSVALQYGGWVIAGWRGRRCPKMTFSMAQAKMFTRQALTDREIGILCGVYHVGTGEFDSGANAEQMSHLSWWPKPNAWASGNLYPGWWTRIVKNGTKTEKWKHGLKYDKRVKECLAAHERISAAAVLSLLSA